MKVNADLIINEAHWRNHRNINAKYVSKTIKSILYNEFFIAQQPIDQVEVALLLTNDFEMQNLNLKYRKINKPTNVLSFPDQIINWQELLKRKILDNNVYLGDIAFGHQTMFTEAMNQDKSFINHFTHLLVHSVLHLLGFDHNDFQETLVMERLEIQLLQRLGIASPY